PTDHSHLPSFPTRRSSDLEFREPIARISFLLPSENIGDIMGMCAERRGIYLRTEYLSPTRAILVYELPLAEVIYDMYDKLKSVTDRKSTRLNSSHDQISYA